MEAPENILYELINSAEWPAQVQVRKLSKRNGIATIYLPSY